jgi:AcrR family transcriptional regulator
MSSQMGKRGYRKRRRAESEERTKRRITEATMRLHEAVGPANTTVSAVAEEAGVQRATVYRHYPDEAALVEACSAHWMSLNAPPDVVAWAAVDDPTERLKRGLGELYRWYEGTQPMVEKLVRDRPFVPAIDERMEQFDGYLEAAAETLMEGRRERGARRCRARAAIAHALEFETWRSLVRRRELSSKEAVEMMDALVAAT